MYVVAGIGGHTGGAAAQWLLEGGHAVTGITRSPEKGEHWKAKGAQIAGIDLNDRAALRDTLSGAEGAYLLLPPQYRSNNYIQDSRRLADTMANAVAASGISHVVLLSSVGAQFDSGTGLIRSLHNAEEAFSRAAKALTVVRAAYFMENWAASFDAAREHGILPSFFPASRKVPMVATADIGRVSAESLLNPTRGLRFIELAGPADYSPTDIAGAIAGILYRDVRVVEAPLSGIVPTFTGLGFTEDVARLFEEMYAGILSGHVGFSGAGAGLHHGELSPAPAFERLLQHTR